MKAYIFKYTSKLMLNNHEINMRGVGFFKTKKIFTSYINYQNALSNKAIYYISKTDKHYNKSSDARLVPPFNVVWINKSQFKLIS